MPYDANGNWKPEDPSVALKLTGLLKPDSPLVQQATTAARQEGERRGLLNSSMTVGAGINEAYKAALPIASQESSQVAQANLQSQQIQGNKELQAQQITGQKELQSSDLAAQNERLTMQLGSDAALAAAERAAQKERLGLQLTADEQKQVADLAAAKERLGIQLASDQTINAEKIANDRNATIAGALVKASETYATTFNAIAGNPQIPAGTRAKYLADLETNRAKDTQLISQLYGIDLSWNTAAPNTTPPAYTYSPSGGFVR